MGLHQSKEEQLYESVRRGDTLTMRHLYRTGASLNTPLILACSSSHLLPLAVALLELGANVNYYNPESSIGTALQRAAKGGLANTAELLLSHGANPLLRDCYGRNALDCAREQGSTAIVRAIENKICFFCGWLRETRSTSQRVAAKRIWAVVLPSDSSLSRSVSGLRIAMYEDRQSPRPFKEIAPDKFNLIEPDFRFQDPELVLVNKFSSNTLRLLSGEVGDNGQLKLLLDTCRGVISRANDVPSEAPVSAASAPPSDQEDAEIAIALVASIQSAVEEGIPPSAISFDIPTARNDYENGRTPPADASSATVVEGRWAAKGVGTSGSSSSCVICADAPNEAACVPCGHLAGCMNCLTEVKMKNFGCPVCRARIERILKIYAA